jgi:hypothetical protein
VKTNGGIIGDKITLTNNDATGKFDIFDQYCQRIDNDWPFSESVTLSEDDTSLNETDNRTCTVSVTAQGFSDGDTLYYAITGVSSGFNSSDLETSLTGSFTISGDGSSATGSFDITVATDGTDETPDTETFTYTVRKTSSTGPVLATGSDITINDTSTALALDLDFYVNAYGTDIGTLDVYLLDNTGAQVGSALYSRAAGSAGTAWFQASGVSSPSLTSGSTYYIAWKYVSGSSFRGDIALDAITIQGTTYGFEDLTEGFTRYKGGTLATAFSGKVALTTSTALYGNWARDANGTASSSTGPSSAYAGTYYAYVETSSSGSPSVTAWLFSPSFTV